MKVPKEMFYYETLKAWNQRTFSNILPQHILNEEISIKNKETGEHEFFWSFIYNKKRYLIRSHQTRINKQGRKEEYDVSEDFPIIINATSKINYSGKVYHIINDYKSVKIGPEKNHSVKEIIDTIFPLEHTDSDSFLLMKIIAFASYVSRINCRLCSDAGFGQDSLFKIMNLLLNDVCTINPRSTAAAEYRLTNNTLVLNELSNLSSEQVSLMQELLLMIGDMSTNYNKSTRGKQNIGSFDTYDISNLSLVILYNNPDYYESVGQDEKFFDNVFQRAVTDRFLPLKLKGQLDMEQFDKKPDFKYLLDNYSEEVRKIIKSIAWYNQNWNEFQENRWEEQTEVPELKGRHPMHYYKIRRVMQSYAESQQEYNKLVINLNRAYQNYFISGFKDMGHNRR